MYPLCRTNFKNLHSMFDIVIKNGTVLDGTGKERFRADIGIKDDVIYEIGDLSEDSGKVVIEAAGKFIAPGFIDVGSHSDTYWTLLSDPSQASLVHQGITTIIGGNCGSSLAPLLNKDAIHSIQKWARIERVNIDWRSMGEFLDWVGTRKIGVNFGTLVGHSTLRRAFAHDEARALQDEEQKALLEEFGTAMKEGAFGLSSGLVYTHGRPGGKEEIHAFAEVVESFSGVYTTHLRNEMGLFRDAVREALEVASATHAKVHISHLKILGRYYWSRFPEILEEIDEEVRVGSDVTFDICPYTATGSVLYTLLPDWASRGGKSMMLARLRDSNSRREIMEDLRRKQLDYSKIRISLAKSGSKDTLEEMAMRQGIDAEEVILNLLQANEGRVIAFMDLVSEDNLRKALQSKHSLVATDGVGYSLEHKETGDRIHPRSFGAFPRVLGKYVREEGILTWEEAIFKMTGQPARKFDISKRGELREGYFADMVVFDPEKISDTATFDHPYQYAVGVEQVLINGQLALNKGVFSEGVFGEVLKRKNI